VKELKGRLGVDSNKRIRNDSDEGGKETKKWKATNEKSTGEVHAWERHIPPGGSNHRENGGATPEKQTTRGIERKREEKLKNVSFEKGGSIVCPNPTNTIKGCRHSCLGGGPGHSAAEECPGGAGSAQDGRAKVSKESGSSTPHRQGGEVQMPGTK